MCSDDYVTVFKALGDKTRLEIFEMLRGGRLCACKLLERLNITQPTLSHHMKILCDSGLVIAEKSWKWTHYSIDGDVLKKLSEYLSETAEKRPKRRTHNAVPECS